MIKEIPLEESKHFDRYKYNTYLYDKGIKADTCIIVGNLETYYNKIEKIVYVESFEFFKELGKNIEGNGEITKEMLNELAEFLGWKNWSINLYYYDYEEAMIVIKHLPEDKIHFLKKLVWECLVIF